MGKLLTCLVAIATLLAGCNTGLLSPHRIDVQQGNAVEADKADRVREGMTRRQVRFLLGTPLMTDAFRDDRWEYVYFFKPGRGPEERRRLSVHFADDVVVRIQREGLPEPTTEPDPAAAAAPSGAPTAAEGPAAETPPTDAAVAATETRPDAPPATDAAIVPDTSGGTAEESSMPTPPATPGDDVAPTTDCILPAFTQPQTAVPTTAPAAGSGAPETVEDADTAADCVLRAFGSPHEPDAESVRDGAVESEECVLPAFPGSR